MTSLFWELPPKLSDMRIEDMSDSTTSQNTVQQAPLINQNESRNQYNNVALCNYIDTIRERIEKRLDNYELKQNELERIINREKLLEETTRRLLHISIIFGLLLILSITCIVSLFFWLQYPVESISFFFKTYTAIGFAALLAIITYIYPIWHLRQFMERFDKLEARMNKIEERSENHK